jgi:hypothetical protein
MRILQELHPIRVIVFPQYSGFLIVTPIRAGRSEEIEIEIA